MPTNLFFESIKNHKKCDNLYEFCLSEKPFHTEGKGLNGVDKLSSDFLYSISIFSAHFRRTDFNNNNPVNADIDGLSKTWKIVFGKKQLDDIREDAVPFEEITQYRQNIKTLFGLLKKDKQKFKINSKYYRFVKKRNKEQENKNPYNRAQTFGYGSLTNKSRYTETKMAFRITSKGRTTENFTTQKKKKLIEARNTKKLFTIKSLQVDTKRKEERKTTGTGGRVFVKLNTVDLFFNDK